jgi:3-oxoadipate enol-lactonase
MLMADLGDLRLHYRVDGPEDGAPVVFANSLGTDLRLWDKVVPLLPAGVRIVRYDMRGHGLSDAPPAPYSMGALVHDLERLIDHLRLREVLLVGLSIGGMVAQGLAVKRADQVRAMVLSNTAAKIGTAEMWQDRVATVNEKGVAALAEAVLQRWFPARLPRERRMPRLAPHAGAHAGRRLCRLRRGHRRNRFLHPHGSGLRLPTLGIAGSEDGSTPPDLVRETVELIPGSRFALIRGSGHLPCVDQPEAYAAILNGFITDIGHLQG